jgi:UPF0042 nucleotide-binding protein
VIDTSALNVHQLRRRIITEFAMDHATGLSLLFESFAYKRGVPAEADFVFDARVLPNPLGPGPARAVRPRRASARLAGAQPDVALLRPADGLLDTWLPRLGDGTAQLRDRGLRLHRRQASFGVSGRALARHARGRAGKT